jgi:hypothetical protein
MGSRKWNAEEIIGNEPLAQLRAALVKATAEVPVSYNRVFHAYTRTLHLPPPCLSGAVVAKVLESAPFIYRVTKSRNPEVRTQILVLSIGCGNAQTDAGILMLLRDFLQDKEVQNPWFEFVFTGIEPSESGKDALQNLKTIVGEKFISTHSKIEECEYTDYIAKFQSSDKPKQQFDIIFAFHSLYYLDGIQVVQDIVGPLENYNRSKKVENITTNYSKSSKELISRDGLAFVILQPPIPVWYSVVKALEGDLVHHTYNLCSLLQQLRRKYPNFPFSIIFPLNNFIKISSSDLEGDEITDEAKLLIIDFFTLKNASHLAGTNTTFKQVLLKIFDSLPFYQKESQVLFDLMADSMLVLCSKSELDSNPPLSIAPCETTNKVVDSGFFFGHENCDGLWNEFPIDEKDPEIKVCGDGECVRSLFPSSLHKVSCDSQGHKWHHFPSLFTMNLVKDFVDRQHKLLEALHIHQTRKAFDKNFREKNFFSLTKSTES